MKCLLAFRGREVPDEPQICAPGEIDPEMLNYYAKKLG
jgi:hypothetical protein